MDHASYISGGAMSEITPLHGTTILAVRRNGKTAIADQERSFILSGNGDVIEPENGISAIGSGGPYALAAARALIDHTNLDARAIVEEAMKIAGEICIYTNSVISIEEL